MGTCWNSVDKEVTTLGPLPRLPQEQIGYKSCPQEGCPPWSHLGCGHGGPWMRRSSQGAGPGCEAAIEGTHWRARSVFILPVQWAWITAGGSVCCSSLLRGNGFPLSTSLLLWAVLSDHLSQIYRLLDKKPPRVGDGEVRRTPEGDLSFSFTPQVAGAWVVYLGEKRNGRTKGLNYGRDN